MTTPLCPHTDRCKADVLKDLIRSEADLSDPLIIHIQQRPRCEVRDPEACCTRLEYDQQEQSDAAAP